MAILADPLKALAVRGSVAASAVGSWLGRSVTGIAGDLRMAAFEWEPRRGMLSDK